MSLFYIVATISGLLASLIAVDDLKASFDKADAKDSAEEEQVES